jgi:hypothetical protein
MSLGPATIVEGPAPQAPQFTLWGAAQNPDTVPDETGNTERWVNGVNVSTYGCGPALGYVPCSGSGTIQKDAGGGPGLVEDVQPVVVYLPVRCHVQHAGVFDDLRSRASVTFQAVEYALIEHEFWTGQLQPSNPHLAAGSNVTQLYGGAAVSLRRAVGALERCIAKTGMRGMIHCAADVGSDLVQSGGAKQDGSRLVTPLGTIVVPGYGYPGTSPDGTDPGLDKSWAYATGLVQLRRQPTPNVIPERESDAFDRSTNEMLLTVERAYLAAWDGCLHNAVLIDRNPA